MSLHDLGIDVLGAAGVKTPARVGFVVTKLPSGKSIATIAVHTPRSGDHKASIANATAVAKNAAQLGNNLKKAIDAAERLASTMPAGSC